MKQRSEVCLARLKDGRLCRYKGRPEYRGYCGHHKEADKQNSAGSEQTDKRLVNIVTAGAALAELTIRAVEYLPDFIEILVPVSQVAFVTMDDDPLWPQPEEVFENRTIRDRLQRKALIPFQASPKAYPERIRCLVEEMNWDILANLLDYDFDLYIDSGEIPEPLYNEIFAKKRELVAALRKLGYNPGSHTANRPVRPHRATISRILDQ